MFMGESVQGLFEINEMMSVDLATAAKASSWMSSVQRLDVALQAFTIVTVLHMVCRMCNRDIKVST